MYDAHNEMSTIYISTLILYIHPIPSHQYGLTIEYKQVDVIGHIHPPIMLFHLSVCYFTIWWEMTP